jgi:hypothetical protein
VQNSPGIALAALGVALALAGATVVSVLAGTGDPALNELQIGTTAWALALGIFGIQGIVSVLLEGRQLVPGTFLPQLSDRLSLAIAALSVLLFILAGLTALAIVSGQPTAMIGSAAGAGCLTLGLLLLVYKEALIGREAHLEPRHDGVPW